MNGSFRHISSLLVINSRSYSRSHGSLVGVTVDETDYDGFALHMKYDPCRNDKSINNFKASTGLKVLWFVWNTDLYENTGYSFRHRCFWAKIVSKRELLICPRKSVIL